MQARDHAIVERLTRLVCPAAGSGYSDCCRVAGIHPPLEASSHLIGHLLREVFSMIEQVGLGTHHPTSAERLVRCSACNRPVGTDSHKQRVGRILDALGIPRDDDVASLWVQQDLQARAHRADLSPWRPFDESVVSSLNETRRLLDVVLDGLERHHDRALQRIDSLAEVKSPRGQDAETLLRQLPQTSAVHEYLFSKLASPKWLELKTFRKFFEVPPDAITLGESGPSMWRRWPAAEYLCRMAVDAPDATARILSRVKFNDNPFVLDALVRAASQIPAELAVEFADHYCDWIVPLEHARAVLPVSAIDLVSHLALGGETESAAKLLSLLLRVEQNAGQWKRIGLVTIPSLYRASEPKTGSNRRPQGGVRGRV